MKSRTNPFGPAGWQSVVKAVTLMSLWVVGVQTAHSQVSGAVDIDLTLTLLSTPSETHHGQTIPLKAAKMPLITGAPGQLVNLNVLDYNPIFYSYSVTVVQAPTASAEALSQIISKLQAFGKPAAGGAATVPAAGLIACETAINEIDVTELKRELKASGEALSTVLPDNMKTLAMAPAVATLRTNAQAAQAILQSYGEAATKAAKNLQDLHNLLLQSVSGAGQFTVTYCDPGTTYYPPKEAAPAASLTALMGGLSRGSPNAKQAKTDIEEMLAFADDSFSGYVDTLKLLATLIDQLPAVAVRATLHTPDKNWPDFASGFDNTVTVNVAENKTFKPLLANVSSDIEKHSGDYKIGLKTRELLDLSISAAVLYSFVKNPTYSVQTVNGKLTVMQTAADYNKVAGAIAFNMTPARWESYFLRPHLQVGVVPDSSKTAILLGLGFSAGLPGSNKTSSDPSKQSTSSPSQLDFNIGAIYQKTTELGAGLAVGQVVTSTQDLKTDTTYKAGLYVGIGYSFK